MALQHKRTEDALGKQFDDLFIIPDTIDPNKDKFLKNDDEQK
ncbi:hypothetical protein WOSG25_021020 [Weissella oryzae SG25]|uniref:Uncharacterized protein n=1 Tax=Weissella oryzae (strain DSM 25784 / JCM 18191 / LMG 30913 / SG25) TaxID=1329250 RepID=A0A069CRF2_WEIOS|nr:hypothetical protein [Weissella oryzae]GAK30305.1 hypothetical protein WOSG25_021020 [Weissella oryzae SG25]